jgi:hypothetical protein
VENINLYQDDDKEVTVETNKSMEPIVIIEKPKEIKDGEREDLITRFDRIVKGESDSNLQV